MTTSTKTAQKISDLLTKISKGKISVPEEYFSKYLNDLGVDSVLLLTLIVEIEDAFGYEWDDDTPETVFFSVNSIALFLDTEGVVE